MKHDFDHCRTLLCNPNHPGLFYWRDSATAHGFPIPRNLGKIQIVDIFRGKRPAFFDEQTFKMQTIRLMMGGMVLVDTNVATYLRQLVESDNALREPLLSSTRLFLEWFATSPFGLHPAFAFLEAHNAGSSEPDLIRRTAKAIITISYMDREVFRATGKIRIDDAGFEAMQREHGFTDPDLLSEDEARKLASLARFGQNDNAVAILGKSLTLERRFKREQFRKKVEALCRFIDERKLAFSPIEFGAALMNAAGFLNKFLSVDPSMRRSVARNKVLRASWDTMLLHMPTLEISRSTKELAIMYMIATADYDLASIGSNVRFDSVLSNGKGFRMVGPDFDFEPVLAGFEHDVAQRVGRSLEDWFGARNWLSDEMTSGVDEAARVAADEVMDEIDDLFGEDDQ